jgi:hypothetical protein
MKKNKLLADLVEAAHQSGRSEAKADMMEKLADLAEKHPELNFYTIDQVVKLISEL